MCGQVPEVRRVPAARAGPRAKSKIIHQTGPGVFSDWAKELELKGSDVATRFGKGHTTVAKIGSPKYICYYKTTDAPLLIYYLGSSYAKNKDEWPVIIEAVKALGEE